MISAVPAVILFPPLLLAHPHRELLVDLRMYQVVKDMRPPFPSARKSPPDTLQPLQSRRKLRTDNGPDGKRLRAAL